MTIEHGGSGQGINPDLRQASENTQPDQAALDERERRNAYQREWQRRRYHQNPEPARERARERYRQNPAPARERARQYYRRKKEERSAYNKAYYQEHREEIRKRRSEQYRRKKEGQSEGGETVIFTDRDYWKSEPVQDPTTSPK
jgi:hypothetical protein